MPIKTPQERLTEYLNLPLSSRQNHTKWLLQQFTDLQTEKEEAVKQAVEEENKRCVEVVRSELIMYPDSQRVLEDRYNFGLLNAEKALTNKQNV